MDFVNRRLQLAIVNGEVTVVQDKKLIEIGEREVDK